MKILAIDTSTIAASAAVIDEDKLHGEYFTDYKLKHSEKIIPLIDHLLTDLHLDFSAVDAYALSAGPGSFTGLRIGAATAKGFSQAARKPLIGISSLKACAFGQSYFDGFICPVFDAQQQAVYAALYHFDAGKLIEDQAPCVSMPEELSDLFQGKKSILFCGDAVPTMKERISKLYRSAVFAGPLTLMPRASCVGALALERALKHDFDAYDTFLPEYIRASQAEVNYRVKA